MSLPILDPPPLATLQYVNGVLDPQWQAFYLKTQTAITVDLAPADAGYWLTQANSTLTAAANLGLLVSGHVSITVAAGVATPSSSATIPAADISGVLAIAQGGTNATATPTAGGVAYGTGTAYDLTAAGVSGYLFVSQGAGAPVWQSVSAAISPAGVAFLNGTTPFTQIQTFSLAQPGLTLRDTADSNHEYYLQGGVNISDSGAGNYYAFGAPATKAFTWVVGGISVANMTSAGLLTIASGLTAGSGTVAVTDATGKLAAFDATHYQNLSGANFTALNASNVSSGSLADARLSANVPLLNVANVFTANQAVTAASAAAGTVSIVSTNTTSTGVGVVLAANDVGNQSGLYQYGSAHATRASQFWLISSGRVVFGLSGGATANGTMFVSGGFSWGDTTDPGSTNFRVAGTSALVGAVTASAGITSGSGAVAITDATGKLAAFDSTHYQNLSGANLTSLTAANLSGTIASGVQDNITRTGTLVSGATGAGFTVALSTSTITGSLADARLSANVPLLNAANAFTSTLSVAGNSTLTGSVGITVSPNANYKLASTGGGAGTGFIFGGSLNGGASGGDFDSIGYNFRIAGGSVYNYNLGDVSSRLEFNNGGFKFKGTATVGTAGNPITYTDLVTINSAGVTIHSAPVRLKGYTVATLPAGTQGDTAFATDLLAPGFLVIAAGGGGVIGPVFYNGTNWVAY